MIKFLFKLFVVWLALQSALGYLREEEIIHGSIEINYPVLQRKVLEVIPTEQISEAIIHLVTKKLRDALDADEERSFLIHRKKDKKSSTVFREIVHVVDCGDTLTDLSDRYGVSWKVIKKINHIENKDRLQVGQRLRIPSRVTHLT